MNIDKPRKKSTSITIRKWFNAVKNGKTERVAAYLENGVDINSTDTHGETALLYAVDNNDLKMAELLLEYGSNINFQDKQGRCALYLAVRNSGFESGTLVKIGNNATGMFIPPCGTTHNHGLDMIRLLLKYKPNPDLWSEDCETPLNEACTTGEIEISRLLIEAGADVNAYYGQTALIQAAWVNHPDMVAFLLANGAKPDIQTDTQGDTALMAASENNPYSCAQLLLEYGANPDIGNKNNFTPLMNAAFEAYFDFAKLLVESGANVNIRSDDGYTALQLSVYYSGSPTCAFIKYLITHGAEINIQDCDGWTALTRAAYYGNDDIAAILLKNGAKPDLPDNDGNTALMYASGLERGKLKLQFEGDNSGRAHDIKNYDSEMDRTIKNDGYQNIVELLLEYGADINARNNEGFSPLIFAAMYGLDKIVKILVAHNPNLNLKDNKGRTALIHAAWRGFPETVKILLEQGADPTIRDKYGKNAKDYARRKKHSETVEIISNWQEARKK